MTITDVELARAAALVGADVVREGYGASVMRLEKGGGDFAKDTDLVGVPWLLQNRITPRITQPGGASVAAHS